jgi:hypothetical protein
MSRYCRAPGASTTARANMTHTLVPVMGQERCIGHLLHTCRGWRACDVEDHELGYFQTDASASAAVLGAVEACHRNCHRTA